jgi:lysyl-tRNA synthetase class 2
LNFEEKKKIEMWYNCRVLRLHPIFKPSRRFTTLTLTYPSRPETRTSIKKFIQSFSELLTPGQKLYNSPNITLCGRIVSRLSRFETKIFFHLESEGNQTQVFIDRTVLLDSKEWDNINWKRGDIIQVTGFPGKTRLGELSLMVKSTLLLTPCIRDLPLGRGDGKYAVSDPKYLNRHREVYFLGGGEELRSTFHARHKIIHSIRNVLNEIDFIEVETPILNRGIGGAFAKPFQTTTQNLSLRIAPELALKRLLISGFDRVYEIGKVFRDEGISSRHNPEFTSIELYQTYANALDMKELTKLILHRTFDSIYPKLDKKDRITPQG